MDLKSLLHNWKIAVPVSTATAAGLLWLMGMEFPRPVLASEYQKDIRTLNTVQLQTREEFLEDRLERMKKEELELDREEWNVRQIGRPIPDYLPQLKAKVIEDIEDLEQTLKDTHDQRIKLQEAK